MIWFWRGNLRRSLGVEKELLLLLPPVVVVAAVAVLAGGNYQVVVGMYTYVHTMCFAGFPQ